MSSLSESVLENTDNVKVSDNEAIYRRQLNRNIKKLVENDENLYNIFKILNGSIQITEYIENHEYQIDDLIWFYDEELEQLKLLRCLIRNNTSKPTFNNGTYEGSGWKDENEKTDITNMGLQENISRLINNKTSQHEANTQYHKYGELKNLSKDVDQVLMKADLSNRNKNRDLNLYPYRNVKMETDNTILNGFYRLYDNGLIEYDIIFRVGYRGTETIDGVEYNQWVCNDMVADSSNSLTEKYFYSENDHDIFAYQNTNSKNFCIINDNIQRNRNDYVNIYGATIKFPVKFSDTNYMIFFSDMTSQDKNKNNLTLGVGSNSLTFINKSTTEISPILITFAKENFSEVGYNAQNGCLIANRFHCKIIGTCNE